MNTEDQIRWKAYQLWEDEGRPDGREHEHWHRAALAMQPQAAKQPAKRVKPAPARRKTGRADKAA